MLPPALPVGSLCKAPLLWACESGCCLVTTACQSHRESRCGPCAARYRRRVGRLIETGATSFDRNKQGFLYLLTVNAPGDPGHSRWIPGRKGKHGACGCHEARIPGDGRWNASASARWNLLRTRLVQRVPGLAYARTVELQRRGLLHNHVVIWSPVQLRAADVQELAIDAGFGCVMDLAALDDPAKSARYLAKYVSKAIDARQTVPWVRERVDVDTGEVFTTYSPTYRAWSSSQNWGVTMADLVAVARRAALAAAAEQAATYEPASGPPDSRPAGAAVVPHVLRGTATGPPLESHHLP